VPAEAFSGNVWAAVESPKGPGALVDLQARHRFHRISAKYMPLYVVEFQFRYNNRQNADIFGTAIGGC
jgi:hypothetical protein